MLHSKLIGILLTVFSFLGGFFVISIIFLSAEIIPMYQVLVVQSGSMEPTIMTGDVIVIKKSYEYKTGDVITFNDTHSRRVTHRISANVSGKKDEFVTKGDANRTEDNAVVNISDILGKVVYTIPDLGYFIVFAKKPVGIAIFLIVPSVLIVLDEIIGLFFRRKNHD